MRYGSVVNSMDWGNALQDDEDFRAGMSLSWRSEVSTYPSLVIAFAPWSEAEAKAISESASEGSIPAEHRSRYRRTGENRICP
jgi:hypothetical protein